MFIPELQNKAEAAIRQYPKLEAEIRETLDLAFSEIEDGENEERECDMANEYITWLVEDLTGERK